MSSASSPPAVEAAHVEGHFSGRRGCRIYWQGWTPEGPPRAVVVIAHGASEHGGRYRYVVERLLPDEFAIYAPDHRGHGRSEGPRAYLDRFSNVVADLDALVDLASAQHPGLPVFLLGHSMGGCVAVAYALEHQRRLAGLALSAPLAHIAAAPLPLRMVARTLSKVAPKTGVYEVEAHDISRDPGEVRAYDEDPLVYRGKLPARTVTELADTIGTFEERVPEIDIPLLVMHGTGDRIVPIQGAEMIVERASSTDKTFERYDGYYHELFNEPLSFRARPLGDLAAWLAARC